MSETQHTNPKSTGARFDAFEVAIELIAELKGIMMELRRSDADLAKQVRRAASSVALNVAEGRYRRGRDRSYHFRVAAGSAAEVQAALAVAVAWGYLDAHRVQPAVRLIQREQAMLARLSR